MDKKAKKKKREKRSRQRPGKTISFETAIFLFACLRALSDNAAMERMLRLALRGPDLLRDFLNKLAESQGFDTSPLLSDEDTSSASRAEVKELAEPLLKSGAEMATFAQIADIYLFGKKRTPENLVYFFYIAARVYIAGERTPTKKESARIWKIALKIARSSKVGEPFWKEMGEKDPRLLEDWIEERKENARKKYETFLSQKRRAEATAQKAFKAIMADTFGDEEF